jgi:uncharacterized RDD family membrane protein YckC
MEQTRETDLLQEFENEMNLEPVSNWVRFGNYFIDRIAISSILKASDYVIDYAAFIGVSYDDTTTDYSINVVMVQILFSLLISFFYYAIFEGATNGRTLGKILTRSCAIKDNGVPITSKDAILRSLCRLIPFNAVSALFGAPWHDSLTRTTVVRKP